MLIIIRNMTGGEDVAPNATVSVDLGSGPHPRNPFNAEECVGLDSVELPGVIRCRLGYEQIPLPDSSVDYVTAYDCIEHVPRAGYTLDEGRLEPFNPFIYLMSEIWRILRPNGVFYAFTPVYPHKEAFRDPEHVNIITDDSWEYFAGSMLPLTQQYGFTGTFKPRAEQLFQGAHVIWDWIAIK